MNRAGEADRLRALLLREIVDGHGPKPVQVDQMVTNYRRWCYEVSR